MTNLSVDLASLTSISACLTDKLCKTSNLVIGHAVFETVKTGEHVTEIDVGYGILSIFVDGETIKYRFTPSKALENTLVNAIVNNTSPLADAIEDKLVIKLKNTYRELV